MGAKRKVKRWGPGNRQFTVVEEGATVGAQVGRNLTWPNGAVVTEAELRSLLSGQTVVQGDGEGGEDGQDGEDGADGLGWTGASYDAETGIVTFTSDDGLGFTTGDLRGAAGEDGEDGSDGPTAVSADAGNRMSLGSDNLIFLGEPPNTGRTYGRDGLTPDYHITARVFIGGDTVPSGAAAGDIWIFDTGVDIEPPVNGSFVLEAIGTPSAPVGAEYVLTNISEI